jgi:hypothetical protein
MPHPGAVKNADERRSDDEDLFGRYPVAMTRWVEGTCCRTRSCTSRERLWQRPALASVASRKADALAELAASWNFWHAWGGMCRAQRARELNRGL